MYISTKKVRRQSLRVNQSIAAKDLFYCRSMANEPDPHMLGIRVNGNDGVEYQINLSFGDIEQLNHARERYEEELKQCDR
jgi:hypothetical protein